MEDTELGTLHGPDATGPRSVQPRKLARGELVGRYVVVEKLGAGGMGVVYSAYDPELDRRVALKLLNPRGGGAKASRGRARLIREAQALAQLNHTNVVTVHDVGEHEGRVFIAMEFVDGITLATWIAQGPHLWHEVVDVLTAAAHGLIAAHAKDMTHRDFKPDNVMLTGVGTSRRVVVMDFGLATAPSIQEEATEIEASTSSSLAASIDLDSLTRTGTMMGTPAYMAPEQHTGTADQHADQFSFCVTLYEALYGSRPFAGTTTPELLASAIYGDIQPAPSGDAVPRWVRDAVIRGLEADPTARWPTMSALIDALHDNPSRRRWLAMGTAGVLLTGAAVYGTGWVQEQRLIADCTQEASALAEFWGDPQRETIQTAFSASPVPYAANAWSRVEAKLDEEVHSWSTLRLSTCLSRTSLEPQLRTVQDGCFEDRRRRVHNAVTVLSEPDTGVIQRATELVQVNTGPCAETARLHRAPPVPANPAARARQQELRQDLNFGNALRRAGRFDDARHHLEKLLETVTAEGEHHLQAAVQHELGHNLLRLGRFAEAATTLEDAYFEARRIGYDSLAARAATTLVKAHGRDLADSTTGLVWSRHAQLLVDPEADPIQQAHLDLARAHMEFTRGNYRDAIELGESSLAVLESELGEFSTVTQDVKEVLLAAYDKARDTHDAVRLAREVLHARSEALGPLHPNTLGAHANLAAALTSVNKFEEAEKHARASVVETGAEPDLGTATRLENLAIVLDQTGRVDEALDLTETVLTVRRKHLPPTHLQLGHTLVNMSVMLFRVGRVDEVEPLVDEAVNIYRTNGGPTAPFLVNTYRLKGGVLAGAGRYEEARESFEAAAEAQARVLGATHPATINIRVELAQAAVEQGDYEGTIELTKPWIENTKGRDDVMPGTLVALHTVHGRAQLVAGDPELAKASLELALELVATASSHKAWAPAIEIDLGRLRWKTTPDKAAAIADVKVALAKLKAQDSPDPREIKRAETCLRQVKR